MNPISTIVWNTADMKSHGFGFTSGWFSTMCGKQLSFRSSINRDLAVYCMRDITENLIYSLFSKELLHIFHYDL